MARSTWSDPERFAYVVLLLEAAGNDVYKNTPVPEGRTVSACTQMIGRLKETYKNEIAAIKGGQAAQGGDGAGTQAKATPKRSRKAAAPETGDQEGSPKKRGRPSKKKVVKEDSVEQEVSKSNVKEETVKEERDVNGEGEVA